MLNMMYLVSLKLAGRLRVLKAWWVQTPINSRLKETQAVKVRSGSEHFLFTSCSFRLGMVVSATGGSIPMVMHISTICEDKSEDD